MQEDDSEEDVCADSDGLDSIYESDEDDVKKYPLFDPKKDSEKLELKLGLVFSPKKEAKFTIESYCIKEGRAVKFIKNDNIQLWAKCNDDNCSWKIHVAKMTNDNCWQVKNFDGCHSHCVRDLKNKRVNSTWLGKTFAKKIGTNPKLGHLEFREEISVMVQKYCAELKRSDAGATVVLKLTEDDEGPRFQRERAEKLKGRLCSKIRDVLSKVYVEEIRYSPMKSDEMHYQITRVDDRRDQHSVDLLNRSCSFRKYDLIGIPCKHDVCAIWCKQDDPETYVHPYYLVQTYRRCYEARIMPVNGPELWPQCDLAPPLPLV
ncbi:uncharacterized protein [Henckelia pumila]|uniref:uncharacterized protein n=1 Tax=Henckelia pumila TaxID=405737 RepID=UPI003C6E987D